MKTNTIVSAFILSSLLAATAPAATTFLFDFGADSSAGGNANTVASGAFAVSDLASPVNATFGVTTLTLTATVGNTVANSRNRGANTGPASDITRDFIQWGTTNPITITISGLALSQEYEFIIWSGDLAANQIKTTDHSVAGSSGGGTVQHTSVSLAAENAAVGINLHQVTFASVFSTNTGTDLHHRLRVRRRCCGHIKRHANHPDPQALNRTLGWPRPARPAPPSPLIPAP